jgi:hypothetical protein
VELLVEVQALKGLHLLLVKYPQQLGVGGAVLGIWLRPIASRLSSSEASTRTHARIVLEEVSRHMAEWSEETLKMAQDCASKYILPTMKINLDRDHPKDAVLLWQLTLVLLKSQFSADLTMLNEVLYVPEKCLQDDDAAVRLITMQAWAELAGVFHDSQKWLFQEAVASLLVWPIKVCLEQELLLNVVEASFVSWRKIVSVAVRDFDAYLKEQKAVEAAPQSMPRWKFWFGELVMAPVLTLLQKRKRVGNDASEAAELAQFVEFAKYVWGPEVPESDKSKSSSSRSESSSSTTLGGSSADASVVAKRPVPAFNALNDTLAQKVGELSLASEDGSDRVRMTSELFGIAFMLEDIFAAVQSLIVASDESRGVRNKERAIDLAMGTWRGFCQRIHAGRRCEEASQATQRFSSRLLRLAIEFSFGILTSPAPAAIAQSEQEEQGQSVGVVVASVGFGLEWELSLLAPLLTGVGSPQDVRIALLHPKSKLFEHVTRRMEYLKEMYVQCAAVLERWSCREAGAVHLDFSARANVIPYLAVNLLFEYAVYVDDVNNDSVDGKQSALISLDIVVKRLMDSVKGSGQQLARGLDAVSRFAEDAVCAARELVETQAGSSGKRSLLDELVLVSKQVTEHAHERQQIASPLLDLQQSYQSANTTTSATASTASSATRSEASDADEKGVEVMVQEGEYMPGSLDTSTSSPCLLSGEISTVPSASPVEPSPASSAHEPANPEGHGRESPDRSATKSEEKTSVSAPTTPVKGLEKKEVGLPSANLQAPPKGSQSAPAKLTGRTRRPTLATSQCIYPDLVGCSEGISLLYRHFPMGFRPFFSFYKVRTIGDLSAFPVEKVRTFGLKEPVTTVRRALEEFNGRKDRMKTLTGSPLRHRSGSVSTSPAIPTPSPHKPSKRPFQLETRGVPSLAFEKHKRTKRSLVLEAEGKEDEEESEETRRKPKLADRVTFCLQSGDTGETRITRPGEDSQDQLLPSEKVEEKESLQEKVETYTIKLLQHLRRSAHYMDKLVAEEESMQSEEASLQTSITTVGGVITNYQDAHDLVAKLAAQLQIAAETSSKRCRKLLDKRD